MKTELGTIEQALLENGNVSEESWKFIKSQAQQGRGSTWKTAVALGYVSEIEVLKIISKKFGLLMLEAGEIPESSFDLSATNISAKFLADNRLYPVSVVDDRCEAVVSDPASIPLIEAMFVGSDKTIEVSLATEEAIHHAVEKHFGTGVTVMESIAGRMDSLEAPETTHDLDEDPDSLKDLASDAPVIKLVNLIVSRAIDAGASDIHIEPFEDEFFVRYRIDGILHRMEAPPKKMQDAIISRIKIMAKLDIAEKRLPQDGRIRTRTGGNDIDMRISTIPTVFGESVVMRILDRGSIILRLQELGFPDKELEEFNKIIARPYGMMLVTGPTGSGKTTTLYGALNKINSPDKKIITIEDPVEYQLKGVNQIQVRPSIGLTFQDGLRSIVRQDPDTIMVGEIRDIETAEIAIQAALTGHLVFSTVHTNDSAGAITRLLDMGIEHYLISSALVGALAQRLVRILCKECREAHEPNAETLTMIGAGAGGVTAFREAGCQVCSQTGYRGRVGIYELLNIDEHIRNLILKKTAAHIIKDKARASGMKTLREDGWKKVANGVTSISEVVRVTTEEVL